jgi:hypothetical protein
MHEHTIAAQIVGADVPERILCALDVRQNILGCLSLGFLSGSWPASLLSASAHRSLWNDEPLTVPQRGS